MFSSICSHVPDSWYWQAGESSTSPTIAARLPPSPSSSSLATVTSSLDIRSTSDLQHTSRTPLSGKAKPFISSETLWKPVVVSHASPNSVEGSVQEPWESSSQTGATSQEGVKYAPLYAMRAARAAWFQAYAQSQLQEAKEDVTITEETSHNEDLQEKLGAQQEEKVPFNKHPNHEGPKDKVSSSDVKSPTETKASSRNPSLPRGAKQKSNDKSNECPCLPISSMLFPVKHTFIHFTHSLDDKEFWETAPVFTNRKWSRSRSAPTVLTPNNFGTLSFSRSMAKAHLLATCNPCAYFHAKADGCHWGAECKFCHLCPGDELKKRKKSRIKALKEKMEEEKSGKAKESPEHVSTMLDEHGEKFSNTTVGARSATRGQLQRGNVNEQSSTTLAETHDENVGENIGTSVGISLPECDECQRPNCDPKAQTPSDTTKVDEGDDLSIQKLSDLSVRQLRLRAAAAGADHDSIEDARDSETPKIALIELVARWESLSGANEQSGSDLFQSTGVGLTSRASCENPQSENQANSDHLQHDNDQARREAQRLKQIFIGKAQPEYQRYVKEVPRDQRDITMPTTPDHKAPMSKRQFDRALGEWRRQLHEYNEPKPAEQQYTSSIASWLPF